MTNKKEDISVKSRSRNYNISVEDLLAAAKQLNCSQYIYNESSFIFPDKLDKVIECAKKIENDRNSKKNRNNKKQIEDISVKNRSRKYNISVEDLLEAAKQLNYGQDIYNENSFIFPDKLDKVIECAKKIENDRNSKKKKESMSQFEIMLEKKYLIFIDTSSLMNYNMFNVLKKEIIPFLKKFKQKIYILDSVIYEINKHINTPIKSPEDESTLKQAKAAQFVLKNLAADELYVTPESISVNKHFADAHIISHFTDLRTKYNLCLITNDNSIKNKGSLAGSILYLKGDPNLDYIRDIKVYYINKDRDNPKLVRFEHNKDSNFTLHNNAPERVLL